MPFRFELELTGFIYLQNQGKSSKKINLTDDKKKKADKVTLCAILV